MVVIEEEVVVLAISSVCGSRVLVRLGTVVRPETVVLRVGGSGSTCEGIDWDWEWERYSVSVSACE